MTVTNTLLHSPADVIRGCLIDLGLGSDPTLDPQAAWPIYVSSEPTTPDNCLTVYDTQGVEDGSSQLDGELWTHHGFQVRVRSTDHVTGWARANAIRQALAQQVLDNAVAVGTSHYVIHAAAGIGSVLVLGKDTPTSKRSLFTLNATAVLRQVA